LISRTIIFIGLRDNKDSIITLCL